MLLKIQVVVFFLYVILLKCINNYISENKNTICFTELIQRQSKIN